jgi:hypothetical protein
VVVRSVSGFAGRGLVVLRAVFLPGHGRERGLLALRSRGVFVLSVMALFAFCAVAQAESSTRLLLYGSLGSGAEGSGLPEHATENVVGVAVDNSHLASAGDLYTTDLFNGNGLPSINRFDPSGKLISPPSPFGSTSFPELYYSGAAVNPTDGDLYVVKALSYEKIFLPAIETYNPSTGALVGKPLSLPVPGNLDEGHFLDVQIAADSQGHVYVPEPLKEVEKSPVGSGQFEAVPNDEVVEYEYEAAAETWKVKATFTDKGTLREPTGVAVDSTGNVWVADKGNNRIVELNQADAPVGKPILIKNEQTSSSNAGVMDSVALDGHGNVFVTLANQADACGSVVSPCTHLLELNSASEQVADIGAGTFEAGSKGSRGVAPPMVAVDDSTGRVYVSDATNEKVWIFGPPNPPSVGKELTAELTATEAKLGALVSPGGIPTSYRFEYGATASYGSSTPIPAGSAGEGLTSKAVWAAANSLAPGTTYHYRVVAENELAEGAHAVYGPDQTFTTLTAEQAACRPNEEFRSGFSARLPDCRAYELVTPPVKTSVEFDRDVANHSSVVAASGEALSMIAHEPFPGAPTGGHDYVAMRGPSGWRLENIDPVESYTGVLCPELSDGNMEVPAYSEDVSSEVISLGSSVRASQPPLSNNKESCNSKGLQVVKGEPVGYQNLLRRDNQTGEYKLVNNLEAAPPGVTPADAHFQGASADLSHIIFTEQAPLAQGAQYGVENLYEWDEGVVRLLTWLPNGAPAVGSLAAEKGSSVHEQVISDEGSHVFFISGGNLYVRIDGERTVQIDKAQRVAGSSGGGQFQAASADGSHVLFTDASQLTKDSTATAGEPDLYECVLSPGATECQLTDLTVAKASAHADVQYVSSFGRKDSSHVYFTATGVLATNKREYTDSNGNTVIEEAKKGGENLYVSEDGQIAFITTLNKGEGAGGVISPDGAWFAFLSSRSLTGYDNVKSSGAPVHEIFLYGASSGQLACASCLPSGEAPESGGPETFYPGRHLMDGGLLFFETPEALVPSDTNGQRDVYEYENGQASLISSGTSSFESVLVGAGESGRDVFVSSTQELVPQDTLEGMLVVYDAREYGGFPFVGSAECTTPEGCRGPASAQAALYGAPASQTFSGAGNLAPPAKTPVKTKPKPKKKPKCGKGFVKRNGKCVKSKRSRKSTRSRRARKSNHGERR